MTIQAFNVGRFRQMGLLAALVLCPVICWAETYYLSEGGRTAWQDPAKWKTSDNNSLTSFDAQSDYVVKSGIIMQTPSAGGTTFSGGRLIFGEVGGTKGTFNQDSRGGVVFSNQGVVFANGDYLYRGPGTTLMTVAGAVKVTALAAAPFHLHTSTFDNQQWCFSGALVGDAGTGLRIGGDSGAMSNLVLSLKGDCSGYAGNLDICGGTTSTGLYRPITVEINGTQATNFGTLTVGADATLRALAAGDEIAADDIVLNAGSRLQILSSYSAGARSASSFRAKNSITVNGTVVVAFDDGAVKDDGLTNRIVVLTFPKTSEIDTTKFEVEYSGRYGDYLLPLSVEVDDAAGVKRLVTGVGAFVHLVAGDYQDKARSSTRSSCFTTASAWSDGQLPHAGVHYLVENDATFVTSGRANEWSTGKTMTYIRTPDEAAATREFPGESLTLGDGCRLITFCKVFSSPKLCMKGGSQLWVGANQATVISNTAIVVEGGVVELGAYSGHSLYFDATSTLSGDGTLALGSITLTGSPNGVYRFASDNSQFIGRIHATQVGTAPEWGSKFQLLTVYAESELGGNLGSLDERGLIVDLMTNVRFKDSMTLQSESNRGIYIGDSAIFDVDSGVGVEVYRQLTMNGLLYKQGAGTLSLAGKLRFDSDNGICDVPRANSNLFTIAGGMVKVLSAGAIDGLNVTFGKVSAIELTTDEDNADLVKYGIRNVKTETPFTLTAGKTTIPLSVDWTGAALSPDKEFTQGILTVTNVPSVVAQTRAMLPQLPKPISGCRMSKLEIENTDGTLTFAVNFQKTGLTIICR